jgi:hypothetical protein
MSLPEDLEKLAERIASIGTALATDNCMAFEDCHPTYEARPSEEPFEEGVFVITSVFRCKRNVCPYEDVELFTKLRQHAVARALEQTGTGDSGTLIPLPDV